MNELDLLLVLLMGFMLMNFFLKNIAITLATVFLCVGVLLQDGANEWIKWAIIVILVGNFLMAVKQGLQIIFNERNK